MIATVIICVWINKNVLQYLSKVNIELERSLTPNHYCVLELIKDVGTFKMMALHPDVVKMSLFNF
jgi:hypothetical protein